MLDILEPTQDLYLNVRAVDTSGIESELEPTQDLYLNMISA